MLDSKRRKRCSILMMIMNILDFIDEKKNNPNAFGRWWAASASKCHTINTQMRRNNITEILFYRQSTNESVASQSAFRYFWIEASLHNYILVGISGPAHHWSTFKLRQNNVEKIRLSARNMANMRCGFRSHLSPTTHTIATKYIKYG